jgi:hypothetical protein
MNHRSTLTRRGGVAGLVVSASAAAVLTATAANAAVVNATTAAAAGTVSASATAFCPAGQTLTGGAGSVAGGAGDVTMTDVIPNLATQSVTVWGHSNPGAVPGPYTVVAQAICVPGNPPPGYTLIVSPSANNTDPIKNQVALCPPGTRVLGTGAELRNADGNAFYQRIEPDPALTNVSVTAGAAAGFAGPWQLFAYAICGAPPNAGGALFNATGASNSTSPKVQASGACPAGTITTGVGGGVSASATGNVLLTRVTANAAQDEATAGAVEDGTYLPPWALTAYNICWG